MVIELSVPAQKALTELVRALLIVRRYAALSPVIDAESEAERLWRAYTTKYDITRGQAICWLEARDMELQVS